MRSLPRLTEVLESMNVKTVGADVVGACSAAAMCLKYKMVASRAMIGALGYLSRKHPSPHVREICGEALHGLRGLG